MSQPEMVYDFRFLRGTADRWSEVNTVLGSGEPGVELDTGLFKIGNGHTPWNELPYFLTEPYIQGLVEIILADSDIVGGDSDPRVGDMSELTTAAKDTLVNALNEVNDDVSLLLLYENAKAG